MSLQSSMILWRQQFWKNITKLGNVYSVLPLALIFLLWERVLGVKLLVGLIGIYTVAVIIRLVYFKERPKKRPTTTLLKRIDASSFPSIHAARAFFFAMTITRFYQEPKLGVILFMLAIMVSFSRYRLHEHYASDVIGGVILGIAITHIVEVTWIGLTSI